MIQITSIHEEMNLNQLIWHGYQSVGPRQDEKHLGRDLRFDGSSELTVGWSQHFHMGVSIVMGVPQNGWFIRENTTKMRDLGIPLFQETTI